MVNTTNPHYITQNATGTSLTQPVDTVDFPHSGLIKALNQMAAGNVVVKTGTDFDINQTGGDLVVAAGKILRNGKYHEVGTETFADSSLTTTYAKGYHLLVVADGREVGETVNNLYMRPPTAINRVPEFKLGDTIVAMIEYSSGTSAGSRLIQYFTTNKESNSLSIAYGAGSDPNKVYTQAMTVDADADGDVTFENVTQDKDIIFKGIDGAGTITALTLDMSEEGKALFNAGASFKKDVTIYEDANDADVSLSLGTSATESLTISVLNGGSNKTAEEVHFSTATASATANHGKMVFDIDGTDIATIEDGGIDLAAGKTFSINGTDLTSGTITALNNQTANRLVTIGATTTELDGEANATFDGSTLAITGAMTASTTIQATTSVTSAAIVGSTSVTGGTTTGTTFVKTNGQLFQKPEHVDNNAPSAPIMSGAFSVVYVSDISGSPANNNIELPDPNTVGQAVYTIRNIGANPITITIQGGLPYDGNTTHHALVTVATRIDLPIGQHVTVQAIIDSGTAGLQTGYYIIGN